MTAREPHLEVVAEHIDGNARAQRAEPLDQHLVEALRVLLRDRVEEVAAQEVEGHAAPRPQSVSQFVSADCRSARFRNTGEPGLPLNAFSRSHRCDKQRADDGQHSSGAPHASGAQRQRHNCGQSPPRFPARLRVQPVWHRKLRELMVTQLTSTLQWLCALMQQAFSCTAFP